MTRPSITSLPSSLYTRSLSSWIRSRTACSAASIAAHALSRLRARLSRPVASLNETSMSEAESGTSGSEVLSSASIASCSCDPLSPFWKFSGRLSYHDWISSFSSSIWQNAVLTAPATVTLTGVVFALRAMPVSSLRQSEISGHLHPRPGANPAGDDDRDDQGYHYLPPSSESTVNE